MGIVRFALKYPHTFYVVAVLILFLGITAAVEMPTGIFPEIDIPVVSVIWQFTGLNTTEMEQRFTTYSQYSISSNVSGIKDIEAETVNGISVQKIYFQPDVNLSLAISQVVAATNAIRALLPTGTQPPIVMQYSASAVPVLQIALSSDNLSEAQLYDYGIYRLRQMLAPIHGVTLPTPAGSGDVIRVWVYVPQDAAFGVKPGVEAILRVPAMPNLTFHGNVTRIADALQPGTRTLLTEVDVPNPDGALQPGVYCTVELKIPRPSPALIVPASAIIFNQDGMQVAVVEDGIVHLHKIVITADYGTEVEVSEGIKSGDQVILQPPVNLAGGDKVNTINATPAPT